MTSNNMELIPQLARYLPGLIYRCGTDRTYSVVEINGQVEAVTGYTDKQFLTHQVNFFQIIHPEDLNLVVSAIDKGIATAKNYQIEYRIITPDGAHKWVWETGIALENGELYGFISDRLPGLGRQRRLMDAQKRVVSVASSEAVSTGQKNAVAEAICKHCTEWLNVERTSVWLLDDSQTKLNLVTLHLKSNNTYSQGLSLSRDQFPRYFDALITGRAIDAADAATDPRTFEFATGYLDVLNIHSMLDAAIRNGKKIIGVVCCEATQTPRHWDIDDINFVAELADQFSQTLANAERMNARDQAVKAGAANEAKSRFLATISHEIRTPLNGVLGMAELLQDSPLNEEQKDIADTLLSSGQLLLTVINDVLDFSKIEAGKLDIFNSPVDISKLLKQSVALFRRSAEQKNLEIMLNIEPNFPSVSLDGGRLQQVISNLLSNAIKFSEQGTITVKLAQHRDTISISIIDQGCGISEELMQRLFQPFEQASRTASMNKIQGTGLGLAISQRLIAAMKGTITVQSQPNVGTSFNISLPLELATLASAVAAPHNLLKSQSKALDTLTLWVAEDNRVNQRVIEGLLKRLGVDVLLFDNGALLLDAMASTKQLPDIILMDCEMPVLDGLRTTEKLKAHAQWAAIPVIALTAHALSDYREKTKNVGMNGYLTKPIESDALRKTLETFARDLPH